MVNYSLFPILKKNKFKIFSFLVGPNKQGLIAIQLSVLEALVIKVDENIHPWYYVAENIHPWYYVAENIHPWLLQQLCIVDSVECSVGVLKEPDQPGQICASQWEINSKIREKK